MDFPKRIKQHKNESDSFAIILYKFREIGIFRNITESDYGIDFEIEVVNGDKVEGHCIKVQVKSSDNLNIRTDGVATFGGIQQSSLNYWAEISYNLPVVAIAVDVVSETIFVSDALFWQAISKMDNTSSSKTIEFGDCHDDKINIEKLRSLAYGYGLRDFIYAHKWIMRNIRQVFETFVDANWYDRCCQNIDMNFFKSFLDNCKVLLYFNDEFKMENADYFDNMFDYKILQRKSNYEDELYNYIVKDAVEPLLIPLENTLEHFRNKILSSMYYWLEKDSEYLRMAFNTKWPTFTSADELMKVDFDKFYAWQFDSNKDFYQFLADKAKDMEIPKYEFIKHYSL
jgi:hypothetical protein